MKPLYPFFLLSVFLVLVSCEKNDDDASPPNPVDLLPPATQTGENTIGCLVNGEALLPKGFSPNGQNFQCFYQLVDGEYYFGLSFSDSKGEPFIGINVFTSKIALQEGETYILKNPDDSTIKGGGAEYNIGGGANRFI